MRLPIYQLDAFTDRAFGGNPAAVCLLDDWLDDATLQAIALENNLSETAFLVAGDNGDYELRWFTPTLEIDLCGHATLASAWLILHRLTPDRAEVGFATRSGRLTVRRSDSGLRMDFPADPPASIRMPHGLEAVLGVMPEAVLMGRYCMAVLATEAEVRAMAPDLDGIGELTAGHLIVTAKGRAGGFCFPLLRPWIRHCRRSGDRQCSLHPRSLLGEAAREAEPDSSSGVSPRR